MRIQLLLSLALVACTDNRTTPADAAGERMAPEASAREGSAAEGPAREGGAREAGNNVSPCPKVACDAPTVVASASELEAQWSTLPADAAASYASGCLHLSADLKVDAALTVDASTLAVPMACVNMGSSCRQALAFWIDGIVPGVSCTEADIPAHNISLCKKVKLEQATFRVELISIDTHPGQWNMMPAIKILGSCKSPCSAGELRCEPNNTCWPEFASYCRQCLDKSAATCACQEASGPIPDGTLCTYALSGDLMAAGECKSGACEKSR